MGNTISSPRKGTELEPRVFGTWQSQVERALRGLADEFTVTITLAFGNVPAQGMVEKLVTVSGALVGSAVIVTTVSSPGAMLFDGYVSAPDTVTVRATNPTAGAILLGAGAAYRILVFVP
jgi:hypothetical protein